MVRLQKATYVFIIMTTTLRLSYQGSCNMLQYATWNYEDYRLCTHKRADSCMGRYYSPVVTCQDIKLEELANYNSAWSEYLEIRDSQLDNITEEYLATFTYLQMLKFENSTIESIDPRAFANMDVLEHLGLRSCNLNTVNGLFEGLPKLEILVLSQNNIESIEENSLATLPKLKELYLSDNKIVDMSPLVKTCKELVTLDLSNNLVENFQLGNCSKLEYLKMSNNKVKHISKFMFTNVSLVYLDVSNNKLNYIESDFLENFTDLKLLNLSGNPLFQMVDMAIDFFASTKSLETLGLSATSIKTLVPGTFSLLSKVSSLDLSWNNLTHLPETLVDSLIAVKELYLNGNNISYLHFRRYFRPDKLDLRDNNWQCGVLSSIVEKVGYNSIVLGNVYNQSNIRGIACEEVHNATDAYTLDKEYLLALQEDQDDIVAALSDLNDFLINSNSNQSRYLDKDLEDLESVLKTRDIILYSILLIGVASFAIFAYYCYCRRIKQ